MSGAPSVFTMNRDEGGDGMTVIAFKQHWDWRTYTYHSSLPEIQKLGFEEEFKALIDRLNGLYASIGDLHGTMNNSSITPFQAVTCFTTNGKLSKETAYRFRTRFVRTDHCYKAIVLGDLFWNTLLIVPFGCTTAGYCTLEYIQTKWGKAILTELEEVNKVAIQLVEDFQNHLKASGKPKIVVKLIATPHAEGQNWYQTSPSHHFALRLVVTYADPDSLLTEAELLSFAVNKVNFESRIELDNVYSMRERAAIDNIVAMVGVHPFFSATETRSPAASCSFESRSSEGN